VLNPRPFGIQKEISSMSRKEHSRAGGGGFLIEDAGPDEIFAPEDFTKEHRDIAKAVEDFIKGEIISLGDEIEKVNTDLSRRLMRKTGELGFLAIDIPEKYGGMELDKISSAIVSGRCLSLSSARRDKGRSICRG
jgi:hypothetical protein